MKLFAGFLFIVFFQTNVHGATCREIVGSDCLRTLGRENYCQTEMICEKISELGINLNIPAQNSCVLSSLRVSGYLYSYIQGIIERRPVNLNSPRSYPYLELLANDCKAGQLPNQISTQKVRVIGEENFHSSMSYPESHANARRSQMPVGGLSGLSYDFEKNVLVSVSDHKTQPVIGSFKPTYSNGQIQINPENATSINLSGRNNVDFEEIQILADGKYLFSNEELAANDENTTTLFQIFSQNGRFETGLRAPLDFIFQTSNSTETYGCPESEFAIQNPEAALPPRQLPQVQRQRSLFSRVFSMAPRPPQYNCQRQVSQRSQNMNTNNGIEGMALFPDKQNLLFANESNLMSDPKNIVRIYKGNVESMKASAPAEYYKYSLDDLPNNGLVAMAAVDNTRFLILERSFDFATGMVNARVFLIHLGSADNEQVLTKKLLFNLDEIKSQLTGGFRRIENFEGMTFGPSVNGQRLLFLVSDNNFNSAQRTSFLALLLNEELFQ